MYKSQQKKLAEDANEQGKELNLVAYNELQNLYVAGIDGIDI